MRKKLKKYIFLPHNIRKTINLQSIRYPTYITLFDSSIFKIILKRYQNFCHNVYNLKLLSFTNKILYQYRTCNYHCDIFYKDLNDIIKLTLKYKSIIDFYAIQTETRLINYFLKNFYIKKLLKINYQNKNELKLINSYIKLFSFI